MSEAGENRQTSDVGDESPARKRGNQRQRVRRRLKGAPNAMVHRSDISEAEIDKTLEDSFPASDPPSWNSGVDRRQVRPRRKWSSS